MTTRSHTTGIQWTHVPGYIGATWNPTTGCTRVSPGCDHCYAFQLHDQRYAAQWRAALAAWQETGLPLPSGHDLIGAARTAGLTLPMAPQYDKPFSTVQLLDERRLTAPLRAKAPHAYFVDSMADLFHEDVPDEFLDRAFAVMALAPRHIFQILTKRPERMREYLGDGERRAIIEEETTEVYENAEDTVRHEWPLPNVWLGISAEDQERANKRIPLLLDTPAAIRFVSAEPLLGPIDITRWHGPVTMAVHGTPSAEASAAYRELARAAFPRLDWVIVGGESGPRARPFDLAWARDIVAQCRLAGVPPFVKQLGAHPFSRVIDDFPLRNRHGSDPAEWPEDLRVREWPVAGVTTRTPYVHPAWARANGWEER